MDRQKGTGNHKLSDTTKSSEKDVVSRSPHSPAVGATKGQMNKAVLIPEGYKVRKIEPARSYDVVSFARAMNDDFAPRLKSLFDPETSAAVDAQKSGIYIGWRYEGAHHDCQRVGLTSKCFCGHQLKDHDKYTGRSVMVPCCQPNCRCKGFAWVPSRPEDIGEFWHQRRRDFDPSQWIARCRCKHSHVQHEPRGLRRCHGKGCGCMQFESSFLCAACDRHWEEHQTIFETEETRRQTGLPVGEEYLPFAEIPELRNIALTGREDDGTQYHALTQGEWAIPRSERARPSGNDDPVVLNAPKKSTFRPDYH